MVSLDSLHALHACQTVQEWRAHLAELTRRSGFSQFFFGMVKDRQTAFNDAFISTNYSREWRERYDEEQLHYIDPVVLHCTQNIVPLVWKNTTFRGERAHAFYEQACRYGLRSGVSFPMRGLSGETGIISFADTDDGRAFRVERLSALALIRDFALQSGLRFLGMGEGCDESASPMRLTPREHDCLQWVMRGKTSWETSMILGCSETTVNFHISNVNKKLEVKTRQQAVVKAIRLRLILADD